MASVTRCDNCKALSDESNVGYIGRKFQVNTDPRRVVMTIDTYKDLCVKCAIALIAEHNLRERSKDE